MALSVRPSHNAPVWVSLIMLLCIWRINAYTVSKELGKQCEPFTTYHHFACPSRHNRIIELQILSQDNLTMVDIRCNSLDADIYKWLSTEKLGNINTVQFTNCPVPLNRILNRLGIWGVPEVRIQFIDVALGAANMTDTFFDGFTETWSLELNGRLTDPIPEGFFDKLTKLEHLEFGDNYLANFAMGIFQHQKRLKKLTVWGDNLRMLSKDAFYGVTSDIELNLSNTHMEKLQPDVFHHLVNMTVLRLQNNGFTAMPMGLLDNNKNLKTINLIDGSVQLHELPDGFLANLESLTEVEIRTKLQILPENLFEGSTNIQKIILRGNSLSTLPTRLLVTQKKLIELDISDNRLSQLPDDFFAEVSALRILRLSHNDFTTISNSAFGGLRNLEQLYFDHNKLTFIELRAFQPISELQVCHLHHNRLSFEEESRGSTFADHISIFQYVTNLRELDLSHNNISHFLDDWHLNNGFFQTLDLSYNAFKSFDFSRIQPIWKNITVDLSHNRIDTITVDDRSIDNSKHQTTWILSNNPLKCDCLVLDLVYFDRGHFGDTAKSAFNYIIDGLKCAKPANLEGTSVSSVDPQKLLCAIKQGPPGCSCWHRPNDRSVIANCSNGGLEQVPDLGQIQIANTVIDYIEMWLDNNNIAALPLATTDGYNIIRQLHLHNNSIPSIDVEHLPGNLSVIDVSSNKLKSIADLPIKYFNEKLTLNVSLGGNPWECDCALRDYVSMNIRRITDYGNILCDGVRILEQGDFCMLVDDTILIWLTLSIVVVLVVVHLAAWYYKRHVKAIKMWLWERDLLIWLWKQPDGFYHLFDAYLSFSDDDKEFVMEKLVPKLEADPYEFVVNVRTRDWYYGADIVAQTYRSIRCSRKTLLVLSPNFLKSDRALEYRIAFGASRRLVPILVEDLGHHGKLDDELKCYLNKNSNRFLRWGDPKFFDKLSTRLRFPDDYAQDGESFENVPEELQSDAEAERVEIDVDSGAELESESVTESLDETEPMCGSKAEVAHFEIEIEMPAQKPRLAQSTGASRLYGIHSAYMQ